MEPATQQPAPAPTINCRDCARPIRWCRDVGDPKGPRCWECAKKHRERKR